MTKVERILEVLEATGQLKPGEVLHVNIQHDTGCPALLTQCLSDCICEPDIKVMNHDECK
jgi:hypothetical protein